MAKAGALRKRYILFGFRGPDMAPEELKRSLYAEALSFFGEFGLSYAALKLVSYDAKARTGILRCERERLEPVLGFLALLSSLGGRPARIMALRSSGTIRGLNQPVSSLPR